MGFGSMMFGLDLFGKLLRRRRRGAWALVPWCLVLVSLESSWGGGGVHGLGSMMFGLDLFGNLLRRRRRGARALVPWRLDLRCKSFLNIEWFLHWKLN
jgi:hypothetical protein